MFISDHKKWFSILLIGLLIFGFTVGLAYAIYKVLSGNTLGADYFVFWQAGRSAFIDGKNPYADEVTRSIQMYLYGQLVKPGFDQVAFVYPVFSLVFIYPFIWLDFPTAQAVWMAFFLVIWVVSTASFSHSSSIWFGMSIIFFYPLALGLILGNFSIVVGLAVFILLHQMTSSTTPGKGMQVTAGVCMVVCLIKPQLSWIFLLVAFLLILRFRLWIQLGTFLSTSAVLLLYTFIRFPGWLPDWIESTRKYSGYIIREQLPLAFSRSFLPEQAAQIVSISLLGIGLILIILLICNWLIGLRSLYFSQQDWLVIGLLGLFSYLVHPFPKSYEQIIILVPFLFWIVAFSQNHKNAAVLLYLTGLLLSWAGLVDQQYGLTPVGIYAWPILFFLFWQLFSWSIYQKAEI